MNKQLLISLGLIMTISASTISAMAESTIYTDELGRMHFLGKDPGSTTTQYNFANSEQQDLTRRLYENSSNAVNYVDYPVKNYDQTFGADRLDTQSVWRNRYTNNVDDARVNVRETKGSMSVSKGNVEYGNMINTSMSEQEATEINIIKTKNTKKKRWFSK